MYLIFDSETSGLPLFDKPNDHPDQPHIVQLAFILQDESFNEIMCFNTLIKPTGWTIHPKAQEAHGISIEDCYKYGINIDTALRVIRDVWYKATYHVAHNIKFDAKLLELEFGRNPKVLESEDGFEVKSSVEFCTMNATTELCKLSKTNNWGAGNYKWPTLEEAYYHIFHEILENTHDALSDVRTCSKIFKYLKNDLANT